MDNTVQGVDTNTGLIFSETIREEKANPKNTQIIERAYDILDRMEPVAEHIAIREVEIRYVYQGKETSLVYHDWSA